MDVLAVPMRVSPTGQLERTDGVDALVRLLGVMAATSPSAWTHAPWFGLHSMILEINPDLSDQPSLREAFNLGLSELGVDWARVERVRVLRGDSASGQLRFELTLATDGRGPVFRELTV